ncbi:AAA family ATPase [Clostridium sp. B9]|uniref:AAA family ATPase n=1 Tax=Clostridium sp. B9 TaxID=3423224 RepID=UPI003D2F3C58
MINIDNIRENFKKIEKKLNDELIGQKDFTRELCDYFQEKLEKELKGILLIIEERDIFKNSGLRLLFNELNKYEMIENNKVDEIDLASYQFNLGYNAFLTDLYEKLNDESQAIVFKNTEKASEEIINVLSKISPNSCVMLKDNYVIKNEFLVKAEEVDKEVINKFICNNKFFIFLYNKGENERVLDIADETLVNKDRALYREALSDKDKNRVIKKKLLKEIRKVEKVFDVDIIVGVDEDQDEERVGLCTYLEDNFRDKGSLSVEQYVSYRICKPITNIIRKEGIEPSSKLLVYVKDDVLYCKSNDEVYDLSKYTTPTLEEVKYKLESIIGMKDLKDFIDKIENNFKVQRIREKFGMKPTQISLNMIFAGNAGTGKTNAARITFEYLHALGMIKKNVFKEVSKADFIGEEGTDTAKRTNDIIESALGGVLFIDEAYSLCKDEGDKVGQEIVDALLKGVEDNRDNITVILAGYEKDMEYFLGFNQGLKSRFPNVIKFEDYNPSEMYEIAVNIAKSKGYRIANNAKQGLIELFTRNQLVGKSDLGNARFVRNIVENAIMDASKKYLVNKERAIDLLEKDNFNFKVSAKFDLEEKLQEIIGLDEVKEFLRSQYKLIVAQEKRKSVGVTTKIEQNLNMIFAGNPGTGKTSIARLVAEMLNSMGLLKVGQLVETDRSSFVSDIPGETAKKTEEKFKEALGGVLFIDEAYTLANDTLGREAIETLLKLIEDYSREVIVILAGYEKEMENFFDVNIGLRSRFPLWTKFEDYNPNELLEMAIKLVEAKGFKLSKNGYSELKKNFVDIYENSDAQSGNGRMVRNYVEQLIRNQSIRIAESDISVYEMNLINTKDIKAMNAIKYDNHFNLEEKLSALIGNEGLKDFLRNQYKLMKVKEKRKKLGFEVDLNKYMNMVFTGESGTGKKTVLSIYSEMMYSMGIVKAKTMVEIDKYEFMAMINSGMKVGDILNKHIGKVLYIDKWNTFYGEERYNEIVSELIKFIDNNNNRIVIVLGGVRGKMKDLILANEGLNYRFPIWVDFGNYNERELYDIAITTLEKKGFILDEECKNSLENAIGDIQKRTGELALKNGLMIKQFLDNLVRIQSVRVCDEKFNIETLNKINSSDIEESKESFLKKNITQHGSF